MFEQQRSGFCPQEAFSGQNVTSVSGFRWGGGGRERPERTFPLFPPPRRPDTQVTQNASRLPDDDE